MRALLTLILGVLLVVGSEPAWSAGERRVALVIGNSAYRKFPQLPNPKNDHDDVGAALKKVGFTVLGGSDLTREAMRDSLRQFARAAQDSEAALVFYAGHGLQYRGRNYLVPVDAKLEDEFDLEYETVRVDDVVEELNRAGGARILILDACRNLPLATRARDPFSSTGLAKLSGRGLIVAYATQANQVAYDGAGRNSLFTGAFVNAVNEPGLDATQLFSRVSMTVDKQTGGRQTPELSLSYPGQFYFNKAETEREAWPRVRSSGDPQQLRDFIAQFPNSFLVDDARDMLRRLEARGAVAESSPARQPDRAPERQQLALRPSDGGAPGAARGQDDEKLLWQRLQDEQRRRAEARQQSERDRAGAAVRERERQVQEEESRRAEARRAEQERVAEESRQRKLAEERAAAEAREQQRVALEARREEERRQVEARRAEQERVAEESRQRKLAEERAAAEARERQRLALEAKREEERRQVEARKAEQERLAEEARQRKLAEERTAAEAREQQRLALEAKREEERRLAEARRAEQERLAEESRLRKVAEERAAAEAREQQRLALEARRDEERREADIRRAEQERVAEESRQRKLADERAAAEARRLEMAQRPAEAAPSGSLSQQERDRLAWQQLEEEQRRRAAQGAAETIASATPSGSAEPASGSQPMRLAALSEPTAVPPPPVSASPREALDEDKLVRGVQAELGRIGCSADAPDGAWDKASRDALRKFGRQAKLSPLPSSPTPGLLEDLKSRPSQFCPLECGAGERPMGDQCVAVARPEPSPEKKARPRAVTQERRREERPVAQSRPRPAAAPAQAPVQAASAPRPAAPRAVMGVGF